MADDNDAVSDRPTANIMPNQSATQARPASTNDEPAATSTSTRLSSNSPQLDPLQHAVLPAKAVKPESQPMTTTSSSSSLLPDPQTINNMDSTGPSPYGTRSRNRTGSHRPNYAEDREVEMDYEWSTSKKLQTTPGSAITNATFSGDSDSKPSASATSTRRSSAAAPPPSAQNGKAAPSNPQNVHLPGMSTFAINSEPSVTPPAPSRKRKAPGSGPTAPTQTSSAATQVATTNSARRAAQSTNANRLRTSNLMNFEACGGYLKDGKLKADDGTVLAVNDQIYLVCEPPGEPYYLARIMEFLHVDNDPSLPVDSLRINWFFRPRDIQRKVNDSRAVFASMQSDTCPITSLRGKCKILHRNEIDDVDLYRKQRDSFWYEKMFDRYIHRFYEVIPTSQVINVPAKVKAVLDERWKFVVVEIGRGKELTSAIKSCKRCQGYCASNDSVDCAVCKDTYHMNCVRPPLAKKPARGFGWSCGPCSRKQERKLEARNTPIVGEKGGDKEDEVVEEEEDEHAGGSDLSNDGELDASSLGPRPPTAEQIAQAKLWPYRYLGIHCRVEDALDYDDRIYPRASSRLGPKHQANVQTWHGHSVEFVKPTDIKKRFMKGNTHKKDGKLSRDIIAAIEADKTAKEKRPKWVLDEPTGYVRRGEDSVNGESGNTALLKWQMPKVGQLSSRGEDTPQMLPHEQRERVVDEYITEARSLAGHLGLRDHSTNYLDKALELLMANDYQSKPALDQLMRLDARRDLKEPILTAEQCLKFEEGVRKYGSELGQVSRYMGRNIKHGEVVRYYYMWKKTIRGQGLWDNHEGRKGKKQVKQADARLVDDVADDVDDSAFDNAKALAKKRGFECKFCGMRSSPQWRRAPATAPCTTVPVDPNGKNNKDKNSQLLVALCQRCATLWRCYGIQWENLEEVAKKVANGGGRAWKRRIDEELLVELTNANIDSSIQISSTAATAAASIGIEIPPAMTIQPGQESSKKKQKTGVENGTVDISQNAVPVEPLKKKVVEKPEPPLVPEQPSMRILPCAVCEEHLPMEQRFCCKNCRLTVHRDCYGIAEGQGIDRWVCDMCTNDNMHQHQYSTTYDCVLCSVRQYTDTELMEAPKVSHKKKNDREREKERLEREMVIAATENYLQEQRKRGRPEEPRQALKHTAGNNWVHIVCAVFHSEVKFGDAKRLEPVEGIGAIPTTKYSPTCKLCKTNHGACISCSHCQATVHVACAQQYGYPCGFILSPVKNSRTSAVSTVAMDGESGNATAVVYCREHMLPKDLPVLHRMSGTSPDAPFNNLQTFVRSHKQADTSLTGTLRKAQMTDSAKGVQSFNPSVNPRNIVSLTNGGAAGLPASTLARRSSTVTVPAVQFEEVDQDGDRVIHLRDEFPIDPCIKKCVACGTDASPKWHDLESKALSPPTVNVDYRQLSVMLSELPRALPSGDESEDLRPSSQTNNNGLMSSNGASDGDGFAQAETQQTVIVVKDEQTDSGLSNGHTDDISTKFLCHKCHLRKLKEPTPPRTPTPPPPPQPEPVEPEERPVREPEPTSPRTALIWPSQVTQASPHEPYHHNWSNQAASPYHPPERLSNGVPHSPPVAAHPPPPQYPPQPPPPPQYDPPMLPQTYRDARGVLYRGVPPQFHMPQIVNGVAEPPSFQYRRDSSGQLRQVPWIPPALRTGAPPPPPANREAIRAVRSPSVQHSRSSQGPHGPPEAAENPFAVPNAAQSPSREAYRGIYHSPPSQHGRPHTPSESYGRDSRWPSEGPSMNGASASPSLRNLLH